MNIDVGALSPISLKDGEWSGISRYQSLEREPVYQQTRNQLPSPLIPGTSGSRFGRFSARGSSNPNGNQGAPSPPSSVTRSSVGTGVYPQSDSGVGRNDEQFERALFDHYVALKRYLSASLRDEKGNPRPNRARDKLLRLSAVQFEELSTDVFDELIRRQQDARRPRPNGPAPFLFPKNTFHPKRNQARQKLSTLPPPRFRDLATDVFYELERRFPGFITDEVASKRSPVTSVQGPPSTLDSPIKGNRLRRSSDASSRTYSIRSESQNGPLTSMNDLMPSPGLPVSDLARPTPKVFQSHTIVPNKSTIIEDDETGGEEGEEEGDGDTYDPEDMPGTKSSSPELNQQLPDDSKINAKAFNEFTSNVERESTPNELMRTPELQNDGAREIDTSNKELEELRIKLEHKLADAQSLNESLQIELDRVQAAHENTVRDLQNQIQELKLSDSGPKVISGYSDLDIKNKEREEEINQQRVAEEVRLQAQGFLKEMRMLSELSGSSYEREEQLLKTIKKLEDEVKDWKDKYVKTKAQLRSSRVSSMSLTIRQNKINETDYSNFIQADGMVQDVNITKFQISIDELLSNARTEEPARVIESMKATVLNVRNIIQDFDEATSSQGDLSPQQAKLKSCISATAKNLITATINFTAANSLSPISLLDAAASHLTFAIINLIRIAKIRPTPASNLEDNNNKRLTLVNTIRSPLQGPKSGSISSPIRFQGLGPGRLSSNSSMYSPVNSPRDSIPPYSADKESWVGRKLSMSQSIANGFGILSPSPSTGVSFDFNPQESDVEELKILLEDQTALLVQNIQSLVSAIRSESGMTATGNVLNAISEVIGKVVTSTENAMSVADNAELRIHGGSIIQKLSENQKRLIEAVISGQQIADDAQEGEEGERAWRTWNQSLPPIAFEIAREMKDLVLRVDQIQGNQNGTRSDNVKYS